MLKVTEFLNNISDAQKKIRIIVVMDYYKNSLRS